MAAYLWLLCEQWMHGHLPFDVAHVTPGVPKGINESAVAYVLTQFFPPDPDTNERRNPKLAEVREKQVAEYENRKKQLEEARAAKGVTPRPLSQGRSQRRHQGEKEIKKEMSSKEDVVSRRVSEVLAVNTKGVPGVVLEALALWDDRPGSKLARVGDVKKCLGGAWGPPPTPEILALAITQLAGHGKKEWQATTLKNWVAGAQRLAADAQTDHDVERVIARQTGKAPEPESEDQSGGMM